MTWQVITGDCLEVMPTLAADSVDTIITDPPYGLSFMGKDWDHGIPGSRFWAEALRVAKPGAMLLAFGGSRTFHRLAVAIEDAGWEIRDTIMWVYGSGFPKSHDISKAIDKAAGVEREFIGTWSGTYPDNPQSGGPQTAKTSFFDSSGDRLSTRTITAPATPAAQEWSGYGTALKPAHEPIIVAMKPLDGTFAENAQRWGVAGMWIDGGRVGTGDDKEAGGCHGSIFGNSGKGTPVNYSQGRWPANVIHDGSAEVLAGFPVTTHQGARPSKRGVSHFGNGHGTDDGVRIEYDTGSAARFFYCAKSSRSERNAGDVNNVHPTVKPLSLCRYLARLTKTPTGGVVLDPFAGSGSTGCAAVMEGRSFIGIEQDAEYADIARRRIAHWQEQGAQLAMPLGAGAVD